MSVEGVGETARQVGRFRRKLGVLFATLSCFLVGGLLLFRHDKHA